MVALHDKRKRKCLQSYFSFPAPVFSADPIPLSTNTIIFRLCPGPCQLNHHLSCIGLPPDGLCDQCELPETVEHFIEVCPTPKNSEARQRLQYALNQFGVTLHTSEIVRGTAATKVCAWVRHPYVDSFCLALALQDLAVRTCHHHPS